MRGALGGERCEGCGVIVLTAVLEAVGAERGLVLGER